MLRQTLGLRINEGGLWRPILSGIPDLSRVLFGASQSGAMYDVSQEDTRYQSINAELNAADADADPVGVLLDISQWGGKTFAQVMAAQPELVTNGGFDTASAWQLNVGTVPATISGGVATINTSSGSCILQQNSVMTVGKTYLIKFDAVVRSGSVKLEKAGGNILYVVSSSGTYNIIFQSNKSEITFNRDATPCDVDIDNVSVKEIPGNHLTQSTAASRPTYKTALGLHWLLFDGTDDYLSSTFSISQPWDRVSALQQVTWSSNDVLFCGPSAATGQLAQTTATPNLSINSGSAVDASDEIVATDQLVYERHAGASSIVAIGGGSDVTGDAGSTAVGGLRVGASNTPGGYANMRLYRLIMRDAFSASERALAEAWATEAITITDPLGDAGIAALYDTYDGAWYDPSDTTTMFQAVNDAVSYADADSNPVGLLLDKSQFGGQTFAQVMAAQSDFIVTPTILASEWGTPSNGTLTVSDGLLRFTSSPSSTNIQYPSIGIGNGGNIFEISLTISNYVEGDLKWRTSTGALSQNIGINGNGTFKVLSLAAAGSFTGIYSAPGTTTLDVVGVSVKRIPGNHAYQTTSANRPTLKISGGKYWLEGDGTSDNMLASISGALQFVSTAYRYDAFNANDALYELGYTSTRSVMHRMLNNSGATGVKFSVFNSGAEVAGYDDTTQVAAKDYTAQARLKTDDYEFFKNGISLHTDTSGTWQGSASVDALRLFATLVPSDYSDARIYSQLFMSADPGATIRNQIARHQAVKSGARP